MTGLDGPRRNDAPARCGRRLAAALLLLGLAAGAAGATEPGTALEMEGIRALLKRGDLRDAERRALDLVGALDRRGDGESADAADALDLLDEIFIARRVSPALSLPWARRAAELRRRLEGDTPASLRSRENLGRWLHRAGLGKEALRLHEEILSIRQRILDPTDPAIAASLNAVGSTNGLLGDWPVARSYYERALELYQSTSGFARVEARITLFNLSEMLEKMGDYLAVRDLYERLLDDLDRRADGSPLIRIRALSRMSEMDRRLGDQERSRESYGKARDLWRDACARPGFLDGIDLQERANTEARLATAAWGAGEVGEARRLYLRAAEDRERALGKDHTEISWDLRRLARMLYETGDAAAARPYIDRACRIQTTDTPAGRAALAYCLALQSSIMREMGELEPARDAIRRAWSLGEAALGSVNPDLLEIVAEQARVSFSDGDAEEALRHALRGEAVARSHFLRSVSRLSQGEALRFDEARVSGLDLAISSLIAAHGAPAVSAVEETWDAVVRSRGLILDELIARRRLVAAARTQGIEEMVARLEADRSRLSHVVARGPVKDSMEDFAGTVRSLIWRQERTERELVARSEPFRHLVDRQSTGWARARDALPREAALVAYIFYTRSRRAGSRLIETPSYAAFVRGASGGRPRIVPLGDADTIDALVARWREGASGLPRAGLGVDPARQAGEAAAAGDLLRRAIWDPIEAHLGRAGLVLVVPDGALHRIQLAALPAPDGRFMVEGDRVFHYLSSERDLAGVSGRPRGAGLLALGAPDFDDRPIEIALQSGPSLNRSGVVPMLGSLSFPPLPASRAEVDEIAAQWREAGVPAAGKPVVLVGRDATEGALKRFAEGRRVIHLATHGFFKAEDAPRGKTRSPGAAAGSSPLLASGLALAGANERSRTDAGAGPVEDGILLGEEVLSLDLTGVDWVVLSACGTGLGPVQAREGVHGLNRSFQGAGASTVITTLWEIEDESTRAWMRALYRARLAGRSTAESVRRASLELIAETRRQGRHPHPYHWGGFVAVGDWR